MNDLYLPNRYIHVREYTLSQLFIFCCEEVILDRNIYIVLLYNICYMSKPISPKNYRTYYIQTAVQKVMELFYKYPEKEFSLSDVASLAGVAKTNLGEILSHLEKAGFIHVEKLSKIWRIKASQDNWIFLKNKIAYNLNFIYQSGLTEFLYNAYNHPKSVILFGSFRKGEDNSNSDIDIAIESEDFKEYKIQGLRELVEFEKQIGRKIQIHEFNRDKIDDGLFNNIANGIVLIGFLEVKK